MKLLQGDKVRLRAVEPSDLDLLLQWENDPDNWELSGTLAPFSHETIRKYVEQAGIDIQEAHQLRLMIEENTASSTVGCIDLFDFDLFHQRAGVGILIADAEKRNNGYAFESLQLIKAYAFGHLGLNQLFCNILSDNLFSLKLFNKAGFNVTGTRKAWVRSTDGFKDQHFLQLFKEEWVKAS